MSATGVMRVPPQRDDQGLTGVPLTPLASRLQVRPAHRPVSFLGIRRQACRHRLRDQTAGLDPTRQAVLK